MPASTCRFQRWPQICHTKERSEDISHRPSTKKKRRTLYLPPSGEREDKGLPEQDRFDKRIYLPTNLMKPSGKFLLKPRYNAHPFFPRMMYAENSNDDYKIPSTLDHQLLQTPPPTRQINIYEEMFTPNDISSPLQHKSPQKISTDLDTIPPTELYSGQTGFKHLGKEPRTLHFIDPPSGEKYEKDHLSKTTLIRESTSRPT